MLNIVHHQNSSGVSSQQMSYDMTRII